MSQHGCPERMSNRSKGFSEEGPSQPTMEVLVETLTGTAFEMTVSPSDTVFAIKSKIFRVEGIPVSQQHLLYNLKELEDSRSLHELSIADGARLRLVLGMRGGPISTRRLPPPDAAASEPWPDIERLLESNRDDPEWSSSGGCKVTVLVFRDGERVNMLRVRENSDGTYSPIDNSKLSASAPGAAERWAEGGECADNALTMNKMLELRRRMDSLSLQRAAEKVSMCKTRSEESLAGSRRADDRAADLAPPPPHRTYTSRYPCSLGVGARCGVLPTPTTRARRRLPPRDYGVVGGVWGAGGSSWQLRAAPPPPPPLSDSLFTSSTSELDTLQRHSGRVLGSLSRHAPREHLHLSDDALAPAHDSPPPPIGLDPPPPALALDPPQPTLALSPPQPALPLSPPQHATPPLPQHKKITRVRCGLCRARLSAAAVHRCRCGAVFCAPHRYKEVHGCDYDYKAGARAAPPRLRPPTLPRI